MGHINVNASKRDGDTVAWRENEMEGISDPALLVLLNNPVIIRKRS